MKHSFEALEDWLSWSKSDIYHFNFGILVDMKSLLEFFPIGPKDPLYNMLKQLRLGSQGGYYGMS